jgi:hypothetical protein
MITITVDEQILAAICDAALKQRGIDIFQGVAVVWNAIQQAKAQPANLPPFMREAPNGNNPGS